MFKCLLKRKMEALGRKVANIVSKVNDKTLLTFAVLDLAAHMHISFHNQKKGVAVLNGRKEELTSDSSLLTSSLKEESLTIHFFF